MSDRKFYIRIRRRSGLQAIEEAGTITELGGQLFALPAFPGPAPERIFTPSHTSPQDLFFSSEAKWRETFISLKSKEHSSGK